MNRSFLIEHIRFASRVLNYEIGVIKIKKSFFSAYIKFIKDVENESCEYLNPGDNSYLLTKLTNINHIFYDQVDTKFTSDKYEILERFIRYLSIKIIRYKKITDDSSGILSLDMWNYTLDDLKLFYEF